MKVTMEPGEARAVLRAIEGLLEQKEASDASVDEATRFFDAYDKLSRETAEKLRETQAALKRTELMVTLMVKVVRDCEDAAVKEALASKLRSEVKPVSEYLAPASELPGALRNAVSSQIRKWKAKSVQEPKVVQEREKAVEALEEAVRRAARATISPTKPVLEDDEVRASPLSPLVIRPPTSSSSPPASPRRSTPVSASSSSTTLSNAPVSVPSGTPAAAAGTSASPRMSPRMSPVVMRAPSPAPAVLSPVRGPSGVEPANKVVVTPRSAKKNSLSNAFDSDLDEESVTEKEMANVHSTILTEMSSSAAKSDSVASNPPPPPPLPTAEKPAKVDKETKDQETSFDGSKKLEKSRGSISLPKRVNSDGKVKEEVTPSPVARQGTLRGLFSRRKRDQEGDDEDDDRELVISPPMNVQHEKHVGPTNLESDLVKVFPKAEEVKKSDQQSAPSPAPLKKAEQQVAASPATEKKEKQEKKARPKSVKLFATLRKPKETANAEEELQITGPTEVQHQGHVDVAAAKSTGDVAAVVADAIDSVKNKERPVDGDVFVEEIKFAEAYEP